MQVRYNVVGSDMHGIHRVDQTQVAGGPEQISVCSSRVCFLSLSWLPMRWCTLLRSSHHSPVITPVRPSCMLGCPMGGLYI